jgi:hypothetical protein
MSWIRNTAKRGAKISLYRYLWVRKDYHRCARIDCHRWVRIDSYRWVREKLADNQVRINSHTSGTRNCPQECQEKQCHTG